MRKASRIIFSFIFLFAFLIPTIGETLHQLSHADDFHCNEKSVHHLHEAEHHCVMCDFSFTGFYPNIIHPEICVSNFLLSSYNFAANEELFIADVSVTALRGPPIF